MKHYLRTLAGLIALLVLFMTQLAATAHAGFSAATLRVNLGVTVAPPAAPVTVNGSFSYGVTCVGVVLPQFVLTFPPPAFTIAANAVTPISNNATVSSGTQSFASNDCTFTQLTRPAAPAGLQWSGSPPDVTITNIVAGDPPPVYAASFANVLVLPTVTGVANPPAGGTVTCTPLTTVGANSTCTAVANPNYVFSAFVTSGCGGPSGSSPYITSSPVLTDCTVTGSFSPLYTVTAVANPPGGGTATCTSPIAAGTFSICMATANTGYTFSGFSTPNSSCGDVSATSPYFTAPLSANCIVNAAFAQNSFTVTAVASPLAGGTVSCVSPVNSGATSSCTATAHSGYTFTGFTTNNCGAASATSPFITAPITANCTVTAAFSLNTYPITAAANPAVGGTVTCSPNPVSSGSTASCNATANAGYTFSGFTTSGCGAFAASNPYRTNAITASCTVTAAFSVNALPVTTTVNIAAGGSISCTPNPVVLGNTATCTVVANAGFVLTGVSGCGGTVTAPGIFVTAPITAACSVAATFAPFVVAPSVPVPTLSGWMLILLTLVVVAIGGAICARRLS